MDGAAEGEPDQQDPESPHDAAAWGEVAAALHAFKVFVSPTTGDFAGTIVSRSIGNYAIATLRYTAHVGSRSEDDIDSRSPRRLLVYLVMNGKGSVTQDGRTCQTSRDDLVIVDSARPVEFETSAGTEIDFILPPSELQLPDSVLRDITAVAIPTTEQGAAGALAQLMRKLATVERAGGSIRRESTWVMARALVQLLRAIILEHMETTGSERARRKPTLIDVIDIYIDQHLGDPDLTLQSIADAHYISIRHLHALFEPRETTVAVLIRTKRLERCVDMLVDPEHVTTPVVAIARRVGFTNMSHFGALFRQFTGMTPTRYRAAHAATVTALDNLETTTRAPRPNALACY